MNLLDLSHSFIFSLKEISFNTCFYIGLHCFSCIDAVGENNNSKYKISRLMVDYNRDILRQKCIGKKRKFLIFEKFDHFG